MVGMVAALATLTVPLTIQHKCTRFSIPIQAVLLKMHEHLQLVIMYNVVVALFV